MLKDKKGRLQQPEVVQTELKSDTIELTPQNPFVEMFNAAKRAILTIREDADNPNSEPFFKTIAIDTGQFQRLVRSEENTEFETEFPAIFVHFINVRYLVQQQRLGEGRATMRIRFILNTLNNQDADRELDPFQVFQRINIAIQDAKNTEPALNERCNLAYFDMPTTTNMLQAYWVDYEVWFRDSSAWKYREWVERYLVMPPFTDHPDAPERDEDGHGNHNTQYNEVTGFVPSVEGNGNEDGEDNGTEEEGKP